MKLRLLCNVFFLIVILPLTAQESGSNQIENDYRNFRETFNQELNDLDSNFSSTKIAVHPVRLPDWTIEIPNSQEGCIYAIGISDPGMQFDKALELASLRAKAITALLYKPKISSITDHYSNEMQKSSSDKFITKYVNYYQIFGALSVAQDDFQLVEKNYNSFKEAIVLLKYTPKQSGKTKTDSVLLKIDIYQAERQQSNRFEFEEKCEMYGLLKRINEEEDVDISYYFFRSINRFYEVVSRFNGVELKFPQNLFRYQSLSTAESGAWENNISYKLTNGLWKAYLQSIIQTYTLSFEDPDIDVAQLGDNYTQSNQNLSREFVTTAPNFRFKGLQINNNRLSVILKKVDFKH